MVSATDGQLRQTLYALDGKGYPAYKDLRGDYSFSGFDLHIDHVQGDPFAAPSRLRVSLSLDHLPFLAPFLKPSTAEIALRDFLARRFAACCSRVSSRVGSGKRGRFAMPLPGQAILARSAVVAKQNQLELRFTLGLPARGRRILGRRAAELLCDTLPALVQEAVYDVADVLPALRQHVQTALNAVALRAELGPRGLVAFVADGSRLPRRSGVDDRPLRDEAVVLFESPESLRVQMPLPEGGTVSGMGIPQGVTLIVGGGYHGKSTLLTALERGVYNHIPGDGREQVVTLADAVKIRAEDGRRVEAVDLRPFINNLPYNADTRAFRSDNASGSTSQAANLMEALELGTRLLLLDEDTCATNLMIRDARMQQLVEKAGEPITPFIDRVRQLADEQGVSSILVLGGSGDYFDVADTVIRLDHYRPRDVTAAANAIAVGHPTGRRIERRTAWPEPQTRRQLISQSLDPSRGKRAVHLRSHALRSVQFGREEIDVSLVAQLIDPGQLQAIAQALDWLRRRARQNPQSIPELVRLMQQAIDSDGLDVLDSRLCGDYVAFRPYELAATLNRLRSLQVEAVTPDRGSQP